MYDLWNSKTAEYSLPITLLGAGAATALSFFVARLGFSEVNIVIIYILTVLLIACFTKGYRYGVAISVFSMLLFNFLFSEPVFSFNVYDATYLFTFIVMLTASLIISTLTTKLMNMTALAREREHLSVEKEIAQAVIKEEQLKNNLLRSISHDLRTPLTSIAGSSEMLIENLPEGEDRNTAEAIRSDAAWLTRMVENILSLTRVQEDRLSASIRPEVCEEVMASAAGRIQKYYPGRKITVEVPDEVLLAPMDARLIEQVLINLLDNAVKHTEKDGQIHLSVRRDGENACFMVADSGSGIDPADLPHLFDMFYTRQGQGTDSRRGIGLGLTICQSIISKHHGSIEAANLPGGGARFCFNLPLKGGSFNA